MTKERRKRTRFVERNEACLAPEGEKPAARKANAYTYDLSTGGARIMTKRPCEVGSRVRVRIDLARTGESVAFDAEVRWTRFNDSCGLYEIGVEFLHLTSEKVLALIKDLYGHNGAVPSSLL